MGAVLSQVSSDGTEQPVSFASWALSKVEQRYSQLDKEALTIIYGVHQYLLGRRFTIVSDHKPLMYLLGEYKPIPKIVLARVQRWAILLGAYSYALKYRPGSAVSNADALPVSEAPNNIPVPPDIILNMDMLNQTPITADVIRTMSSKDPLISKVIYYVDHGWPWMVDAELRPFYHRKEELTTTQGCLLLGSRIVIPTNGQDAILQELHQTQPE